MNKLEDKKIKRNKRRVKIRSRLSGTAKKPRLAVFKSNKHIYAQLIDDEKRVTLLAVSDFNIDKKSVTKKENFQQEIAFLTGQLLAGKALKKNIKKIVFDRGGFKYHGQIKSLADGCRQAGLDF